MVDPNANPPTEEVAGDAVAVEPKEKPVLAGAAVPNPLVVLVAVCAKPPKLVPLAGAAVEVPPKTLPLVPKLPIVPVPVDGAGLVPNPPNRLPLLVCVVGVELVAVCCAPKPNNPPVCCAG